MIQKFNKSKTFFGVFLASITIFFWGITFVCTKYLLNSFSSLEILVLRFLIAYFVLWIMYPHLYKTELKHEILFISAGLFGVTLYQFMENMAINYTSASNVSIIVSICPIFTAIITQFFLKEKHLSLFFFIGFILALTGVSLVSFNGIMVFNLNPKGDIIALSAPISWAFYSLFVSKINTLGYKAIPSTRKIFFYALIFMSFIIIGKNTFPNSQNFSITLDKTINSNRFSDIFNWLNLLFLGIVASGFCFVAWNYACKIIGTVKTTMALYLIPVVTIIFAFFVLGETITFMGIIGALITIAGLFISEH